MQFPDNPAVKPYDYFGGLDNWMKIGTLYIVLLLSLLIKLYLMFYKNIPGTGWLKGVSFGLIIGLVKTVPEAFNKWTLIVYPNELIILQLVNGLIGHIVFGILISVVFHKFKVIDKSLLN